MSVTNAYRYSLGLPIAVPGLLAISAYAGLRFELSLELPGLVSSAAILLIGSGVFGGGPYLLLAVPLFVIFRDRPAKVVRRSLLLAPILMLPIYWLSAQPLSWILNVGPLGRLAPWVFLVGYFYVILVVASVGMLTRLGFLEEAA